MEFGGSRPIELVAKTATSALYVNAEMSSEDDKDPDGSQGGQFELETSFQCSEEETYVSYEQPGPSHEKGGGVSHPCRFPGCKLVFQRPGRLRTHMHVHQGERPFKCLVAGCSRTYTNSSHLRRHVKVSHEDGLKRILGHLCSRCSLSKSSRKGREPKLPSKYVKEYCAPSVNGFQCAGCGKAFHYVRCKLEPAGPLTLCHVCGQCFESARDFRRHERGHITYECPYIGCKNREFSYSEMRKHTSTQHSGYTCDECKKKFPKKATLREHVASHLNIREQYVCPYHVFGCKRVYFHWRNLKQHVVVVHRKKRFTCDICSMDLSSKQKLTFHKTRFHSEDLETKSEPKRQPKKNIKDRKGPKLLKANMVHMMLGIRVIDETDQKEEKDGN